MGLRYYITFALCLSANFVAALPFVSDEGSGANVLCDTVLCADDVRYVGYNVSHTGNKSLAEASSESVLSKGRWVKVRVKSSGMKSLTFTALKQMGFDNPDKISVYGNGGTQLPFDNSKYRPDDLVKQPVIRTSKAVLFYAEGPLTWQYNQTYSRFIGAIHQTSEYSYYFITDSGVPSSEPERNVVDGEPTMTTDVYNYRAHYEENVVNLLSSGREWYGPKIPFGKPFEIDLGLPKRPSPESNIKVSARLIGRSGSELQYEMCFNGEKSSSGVISKSNVSGNGVSDYAKSIVRNISVKSDNVSDSKLSLAFDYNSATDGAWIDYISVTSDAALDMENADEMDFRLSSTYSKSGVTEYIVKNVKKGTRVWNVCDCTGIQEINVDFAGSSMSFKHNNGVRTDFVAFNPDSEFEAPEYVGEVKNQNLHAVQSAQYIIVTHEDFADQARRLAEIHRREQGLNVVVAECEQIYNEFSSGKRDVSAIRDFIKMVYDRDHSSETGLKYVLLFGDGSFDNMTIGEKNEGNKVPTYQSANSIHSANTYVTDDFFGWLDDNEGASDTGARMDIGVGRFPCRTADEAKALVDKSEIYLTALEPGRWKTRVAVVADDGDKNEHLDYAEKVACQIEEMQPGLTVKRIYLEAYSATTTSTGVFYEGARKDFTDAINNGSLFLNYFGHSGYNAMTDDGLFKQVDISKWTNGNRLPMLITASCDFGPFDLPTTSSGEESLMYRGGGFIGVFASTRVVFSDSNYLIDKALSERLVGVNANGDYYSMGEASMYAKVKAGGLINTLKYVLLGDPALSLCKNHQKVVTDSINGVASSASQETFSALSISRLSGSVRDEDGEVDESFNGSVNVTLYDKKSVSKTTGIKSDVYRFNEYKTVLFSGSADVVDGRFSVEFKLSKDINFELGYGRMVYYAVSDDNREADGIDYEVMVGGASSEMLNDTVGPVIDAWIDYVGNHATGLSPTLFAYIEDPSGVNTSGLGAGHDIALYFNGDRNNSVSLNGYFTYDAGSYTRGLLVYKMSNITEGDVSVSLKAWDNMNNSSVKSIDISVKGDCPIGFGDVKLFPNPLKAASDCLKLQFSHNAGGSVLSLNMRVYSIDGQLIDVRDVDVVSTDMQTETIAISDEMPAIACLPKGIYVLKVVVSDKNGRKGEFTRRFSIVANR